MSALHPLAALREHELVKIAKAVKVSQYLSHANVQDYNPNETCAFRRILLVEPRKKAVVPYLEAELAGTALPAPPKRFGKSYFYLKGNPMFMEAIVDIEAGEVVSQRELPGLQGPGDDEEMMLVSKYA